MFTAVQPCSTRGGGEGSHDRDDVRRYLEACTEQDPGYGSLIRAALNDIARAHSVTELARETGMTRVGIYKALAPDGNPTFATLMRITRALGMGAAPLCERSGLTRQTVSAYRLLFFLGTIYLTRFRDRCI